MDRGQRETLKVKDEEDKRWRRSLSAEEEEEASAIRSLFLKGLTLSNFIPLIYFPPSSFVFLPSIFIAFDGRLLGVRTSFSVREI